MLAAGTGAGLLDRMGHSTTRAALTYLHASDERQRAIAEALSKLTASEMKHHGKADRAHNGHGSAGRPHEDHSL